jgi:hypothetical protein
MEYCRKLEFTETPNYKFMIGLFQQCMEKNKLDPKVFDYSWKQNRLDRDKKALIDSLSKVLKKDTKKEGADKAAEPTST